MNLVPFAEVINKLTSILPGSIHIEDTSWDRAWDELSDRAQKTVRITKNSALEDFSKILKDLES